MNTRREYEPLRIADLAVCAYMVAAGSICGIFFYFTLLGETECVSRLNVVLYHVFAKLLPGDGGMKHGLSENRHLA